MKDFSLLFIIRNEVEGLIDPPASKSVFTISVRDDRLMVRPKSGRHPLAAEVNSAIGKLLLEYEQEYGEKIPVFERQSQYRFCCRTGMSGCEDTYIEYDPHGDGFPVRKHLLRETCYGKTPGFQVFVYDYLDLMVCSGFLSIEESHYHYNVDDDAMAGAIVKVIPSRCLAEEDGWLYPGQYGPVVPMDTVYGPYRRPIRRRPPHHPAGDEGDEIVEE